MSSCEDPRFSAPDLPFVGRPQDAWIYSLGHSAARSPHLRARDEITSFSAAKQLWLCYVRFGGVAGQPVRGSAATSERAAVPVVAGRRSPRARPGWGWNRGAGGGRGRRHGAAWPDGAPGAVDFVLPSLAQARWWTQACRGG